MKKYLPLAALIALTSALSGCAETSEPPPAEPTTLTTTATTDADVRAEMQAMVPPDIDPADRTFFDATPEEVGAGALIDLLTFTATPATSPQQIAQDAAPWFIDDVGVDTIPGLWGEPEHWKELVKEEASLVVLSAEDVTPLMEDTPHRVDRRLLVTTQKTTPASKTPVLEEITVHMTLSRESTGYWRIAEMVVM